MIFYKTVSTGNDFLHVDLGQSDLLCLKSLNKGDLAKKLCQRKTGPGADGVIYFKIRKQSADFDIYNRDGSRAELSGNGMAGCAALLLYLNKFQERVILHTRVGERSISLINRDNNRLGLKVEIGAADFQNRQFFPFLKQGILKYEHKGVTFYPVSVGNPHAVILFKEPAGEDKLISLAKLLSGANIFPQQVNVEFVDYNDPLDCRVFFYERGVGPTLSSSTGSAAVFAVLQKLNLVQDRLWIQTQEGIIRILGKEKIYVENSAKIVYKGVFFYS